MQPKNLTNEQYNTSGYQDIAIFTLSTVICFRQETPYIKFFILSKILALKKFNNI